VKIYVVHLTLSYTGLVNRQESKNILFTYCNWWSECSECFI